MTSDVSIQCCDFFSNGLGYQFTLCDHGVGVYILSDRKGSADDLNSLAMPVEDFSDLPWDQLEAAVDAFCNQSETGLGATKANVTRNVTLADVQNVNVPWVLFFQEW